MKPTPLSKRPGRLIVIGSVKWKWRLGRRYVVAYSETATKLCAYPWIVKGMTYEQWMGQSAGYEGITPASIAAWLARESNWTTSP